MRYKILGKLPLDTIEFFKKEILLRKKTNQSYQWIQFDQILNDYFFKIFENTDLKIQYDLENKRYVQKAFYSEPNHGFRIHRDGYQCQSAMNIAISCNDTDFVRWYDTDLINELSSNITSTDNSARGGGRSRNTDIMEYEDIPYTDELHCEVGDVYALDVDTFHSFKCIGSEPRIIVQTKFRHYPNFQTISESLTQSSFRNIIK
jgi:hypothetical protein